jgi:hypothetical protein
MSEMQVSFVNESPGPLAPMKRDKIIYFGKKLKEI